MPGERVTDGCRELLAQPGHLPVGYRLSGRTRPRRPAPRRSPRAAAAGIRSCSGAPSPTAAARRTGTTSRIPGTRRGPGRHGPPPCSRASMARRMSRPDPSLRAIVDVWGASRSAAPPSSPRPTGPSRSRPRGGRRRTGPSPRSAGRGSTRRRSRRTAPPTTGRGRRRRRCAPPRNASGSATRSCRCSGARSSTTSAAWARSRTSTIRAWRERRVDDLAPAGASERSSSAAPTQSITSASAEMRNVRASGSCSACAIRSSAATPGRRRRRRRSRARSARPARRSPRCRPPAVWPR